MIYSATNTKTHLALLLAIATCLAFSAPLHAAQSEESAKGKPEEQADSYNNLASACYREGKYKEAYAWHEKSCKSGFSKLSKLERADLYYNMGLVSHGMGDYEEARSLHKKALELRRGSKLSAKDPAVIQSYTHIALALNALGLYDEAIAMCENFLNMHPARQQTRSWLAASTNCIGVAYIGKGQYDKAITYIKKAVNICFANSGENHEALPDCYDNWGLACYYKGDYTGALGHIGKGMQMRVHAFGEKHPLVATSWSNLSLVWAGKKLHDKAIFWGEKSLNLRLAILGKDHPDVGTSYNNIGQFYSSKGDTDEAICRYKNAHKIWLAIFGENHPNMACVLNNLGTASAAKGENDEAISLHTKALKIWLAFGGVEHIATAAAYSNLAADLYNKGEYDNALGYIAQAHGIFMLALGPDHPKVDLIQRNWFWIKQAKIALVAEVPAQKNTEVVEENILSAAKVAEVPESQNSTTQPPVLQGDQKAAH